MKKTALIVTVFIGIASCNNKEISNDGNASGSPLKKGIATTSEKSGLCPEGIGASQGDDPKLEVVTPAGLKLMLCGYSTESEFDVYSIDKNNSVSKSIVTYEALDHVKTYSKSGALVLDELTYFNGEWIPTFQRTITCKSATCKLSASSCIFKTPSKPARDLSEIRSYQKEKSKGKYPDEMVIQRAFDLALAGNKEAQDIFLSSSGNLKLDGASAEAFSSAAALLQKLKVANCL